MEILKVPQEGNIIKLEIGMELSDDKKSVVGSVELDIESQSYFVDMVSMIFEEGVEPVNLIVDLKNVTYIDSSGLWALFEGHKKANQKNGKMVLLSPTKDVRRVLDITKMSSKLQVFEEESAAIVSFNPS